MSAPRRSRHPQASAADVLDNFPAAIQKTARQLMRLVRHTVPTATMHPYVGWKGIGYRDPQAGYFAGIFPQRDHVRVLFEHGAMLDDPEGLLEGGNVRQVRWIVVRSGALLPRVAISRMLHRALVYGSTRPRRGKQR